MIFSWSHGRTENRYAAYGRSALFLTDAPLARRKRAPEFGQAVPDGELGF